MVLHDNLPQNAGGGAYAQALPVNPIEQEVDSACDKPFKHEGACKLP